MIGSIVAGMLAGSGGGSAVGDYQSIATVSLSSAQTDISFTSIPSTYKHLQIRLISRDNLSGTANAIAMQLNSDTGNNYAFHYIQGNGTSPGVAAAASNNAAVPGYSSGGTAGANIFGATVIDILDYASTSKYKTIRGLSGYDNNGSGNVYFLSSLWMNTSAITTIKLIADVSKSFQQYSHFALYGIKG